MQGWLPIVSINRIGKRLYLYARGKEITESQPSPDFFEDKLFPSATTNMFIKEA
jgi:hypothetical protein